MDENREINEQDLEKVAGGAGGNVDYEIRTYRCRNCGRTKTVRAPSFLEAAPIPCPDCTLSNGRHPYMSYEPG